MNGLFVTITGMHHYLVKSVLKPGMLVLFVKEPDNEYDENAIRVDLVPVGCVGYVANSPHTVIDGTMSAIRIYDSMARACFARVMFAKGGFIVARLEPDIRAQVIMISIEDEQDGKYSASANGEFIDELCSYRQE
ncbi:MAG: HIRAN domain-containing protein [Christensenellales bacterium]|jgi:hypothetical protein